jgi:Protein UNC80
MTLREFFLKSSLISKEDEDEDYMDESTVNKEGGAWPFVLKFVVCQLLMEITAYIRETYKSVPKVKASVLIFLSPAWVSFLYCSLRFLPYFLTENA